MSEFSNYDKLINSEEFKNASGDFPVPFGELPNGDILIQDMKKIPHMLVTGVIGCGKTTFVQSLILALCEKHLLDELKLCIYDSKGIDYQDFNSLPHLYVPVVTDDSFHLYRNRKESGILQWIEVEIRKRERELKECITGSEKPKYPEIFMVLDDCANTIMDEECCESISTILDKGRAVGVHLIMVTSAAIRTVATQYILATTKIKVSFYQPNESMSKRAIGKPGAERLGTGEILVADYGTIKKCKALCMDFAEMKEKIDILKNIDWYVEMPTEEVKETLDISVRYPDFSSTDYDELLPMAAEIVLEMKSCSVSMLQKRLKLGYSRAARVVDQLEELGIVGPYEGAKPRSVLIDRNGWNKIQIQLGLASEEDFQLAHEMSSISGGSNVYIDSIEMEDDYDDENPENGYLYIEREKRDSNPKKKIQVYVDGEYTEELDLGDVIEIELPFGEHEILFSVSTLFREYTRSIDVSLTEDDPKDSYKVYISDGNKVCVLTSMREFYKDPLKN